MISPVSQTSTQKTTAPTGNSTLDKTAFLQLLTKQLEYQDPMNPSSQDQMFGMLSQMSQVEQMTNMNSNMDTLIHANQWSLVGRNVSAVDDHGNAVSGVVQEISYRQNIPVMTIAGNTMPVSNLKKVSLNQ